MQLLHQLVNPAPQNDPSVSISSCLKCPTLSHILATIMVLLLLFKQASQPSPKLIIVAPGTNANNGEHEMILIQLDATPAPKDEPICNIWYYKIDKI